MKLNYDCVRELLLTLEENLVMDDSLSFPSLTLKQVCESRYCVCLNEALGSQVYRSKTSRDRQQDYNYCLQQYHI